MFRSTSSSAGPATTSSHVAAAAQLPHRFRLRTSGRPSPLVKRSQPPHPMHRSSCRAPTVAAARTTASPFGTSDLSAGLLEKCFTVALESRLQGWQMIDAKVDCSTFELLRGTLQGLLVRGLSWVTPLGMTVRLFEVSLGETKIDMGQVLASQQIMFSSTPKGKARLVFNAADFGNLFRHPLMVEMAKTAVQGQKFDFDSESVKIDISNGENGVISFSGRWAGDGQRYDILVEPDSNGKVWVDASPALAEYEMSMSSSADELAHVGCNAATVSHELGMFFNNITLDLDGPMMTFKSMQVRQGRDAEVIDLQLDLKLMYVPPLDLAF